MAKVINRAIQLHGEFRTVGTPVVRVLEMDKDGQVMRATGDTVPSGSDAGYGVGCVFTLTTGVVGSTFYVNEGSTSNADFNSLGTGA